MKGMSLKVKLLLLFGVKLTFIGFALILGRNYLYDYCKYIMGNFSPNSTMFNMWAKSPFPLPMEFFIYNWTNPESVFNHTVKPKYTQIGPYNFMETREKVNVVWNNDNNTMSFNMKRIWQYKDTPGKDLSDNITTLNVMAIVVAFQSRNWWFISSKSLSIFMSTTAVKLGFVKPVREILFDGYPDTLSYLGKTLRMNDSPLNEKFSFFCKRNNSAQYEGHFNMDVNFNSLGTLLKWNHQIESKAFSNKCNRVQSSYLDIFKRNLKKGEPFEFFFSDICRQLRFNYHSEVIVNDIIGYKYVIADRMLDNGTNIPGNECYCSGECLPSGVFNISSCKYNAPVFLSLPHFYRADPYYLDKVDGLKPDSEEHEFFLVLEPNTGLMLNMSATLQINVLMQPYKHILLLNNAPKIVLPVLWFRQRVHLPDYLYSQIRFFLNLPKIFMIIGTVLSVIGVILTYLTLRRCGVNAVEEKREETAKNTAELKSIKKVNNND